MQTQKKLMMSFKTLSDKKVSITVDDPRDDLEENEIKTVMTLILSSNVFLPNGEELASLVDAKVVETGTTSYDLVIQFMDSGLQNLVANIGFPIALSMYLLVRIEGKLSCLTDSINELSKNILSIK